MITLADNLVALITSLTTKTAKLYEFSIPEIPATWYYTSFPRAITYNGNTYATAPLTLSNRAGGKGDIERNPFTVSGAYVEPFVSFSGRMYGVQVKCVVRDAYWDGAEWLAYVVANGIRTKTKRADYNVAVDFQPFADAMNQNIPSVLYTRLDARMPYWQGFTAPVDLYTRTGCVVASVAQNVIVTADAAKKPNGELLDGTEDWYKGGYIIYPRAVTGIDGQTFNIIFRAAIVTNTVDPITIGNSFFTMRFPPPLLSAAPAFSVFSAVAGYDNSSNQAVNKFNNYYPNLDDPTSEGFLGFPHLPINNYSVTPVQVQ